MATTVAVRAGVSPARSRWVGLMVAIVIGTGILLLARPHGLAQPAQEVLAITAFTMVLWIFQAMNNGIASVLMMALMILAHIRPPLVFSGFASPSFWILLCVLFYGFAMQRTGLAQRFAYYILSIFPGTYVGIMSAFFLIGFILALGIPSMTVRTAIIVPIAWALVQSLGPKGRSRGAGLIVLTAIEMAVIPGCAFLYGSLFGPVVDSVFQAKKLPLSWLGYAEVMTVPTLVLCGLVMVINQFVLRPESGLGVVNDFARRELRALAGC